MDKWQPQKLSHRHDAVLHWLIANPDRPLKDCAECLGYTPQFIYMLVGSDMFQAEYRRRCEEAGTLAVHSTIGRLSGLANLAIEKARERLDDDLVPPSEKFIETTMKNTLAALGYTAGPSQPNGNGGNHLHIHVQKEDLDRARERAAQVAEGRTLTKTMAPPSLGEGANTGKSAPSPLFLDVEVEPLPS